jgi:hypothetical protein
MRLPSLLYACYSTSQPLTVHDFEHQADAMAAKSLTDACVFLIGVEEES